MKDEQIAKIRQQYNAILNDHPAVAIGWFDPGGKDDLKLRWFDEHGEPLLQVAETFNEYRAERLRAIAFHLTTLVEALKEQNAGSVTSLEMAGELRAMANDIIPESVIDDKTVEVYKEHLSRLQQLRNHYGNDYEGRFLDEEIANVEKKIGGH